MVDEFEPGTDEVLTKVILIWYRRQNLPVYTISIGRPSSEHLSFASVFAITFSHRSPRRTRKRRTARWYGCQDQLSLYDAVVCLDGSSTEATARIARDHREKLIYLHESDRTIPHKTDHGLRRIVHNEIVHRFGCSNWIMCCHADEFCYHSPRKIAELADRIDCDLVAWYSPHFYPHPVESDRNTELEFRLSYGRWKTCSSRRSRGTRPATDLMVFSISLGISAKNFGPTLIE